MSYTVLKLNTARNCLKYVIEAFKITEINIPYYLCPVMRIIAAKTGCKVKFYHIGLDFRPTKEFDKNSYILYPNYFGVCSHIADELGKKYPKLIIDNAHAFFNEPQGIAAFNSIRKFFPQIRDGAVLYTQKTANLNLKYDEYEYPYEKLCYDDICKNEQRLEYEEIKYMSKCSEDYFNTIDLKNERKKVRKRFEELHNIYIDKNMLKLNLKEDDAPFRYPFFNVNSQIVENMVKEFNDKGYEIYRYWENLPNSFEERKFRDYLLAL